jgi:hypothetical protein
MECFQRREEFHPVVELLRIHLEEAKDRILVCLPEDLGRLQGSVIALDAFIDEMTVPRSMIPQKESARPAPGGIELQPER